MVLSEVVFVEQLVVPIRTGTVILSDIVGHKLFRTQYFRSCSNEIMFGITIVCDGYFTGFPLLRLNQNNSVRSARTVDGSGGTIFQYGNRFDVLTIGSSLQEVFTFYTCHGSCQVFFHRTTITDNNYFL